MIHSDIIGIRKAEPIYSGNNIRQEVRNLIGSNFKTYKTFPFCRDCALECKMPNIPTLELTCPRTPDYEAKAKTRGGT